MKNNSLNQGINERVSLSNYTFKKKYLSFIPILLVIGSYVYMQSYVSLYSKPIKEFCNQNYGYEWNNSIYLMNTPKDNEWFACTKVKTPASTIFFSRDDYKNNSESIKEILKITDNKPCSDEYFKYIAKNERIITNIKDLKEKVQQYCK